MWHRGEQSISYVEDGVTAFEDSRDHFENALCRLLGVDAARAEAWIEGVASHARARTGKAFGSLDARAKVEVLESAPPLWPPPADAAIPSSACPLCKRERDRVNVAALGHDPELALVGCDACDHGWLAGSPKTTYDESYFAGEQAGVGYGDLMKQKGWRLEKSARLVRQMIAVTDLKGLARPKSVLDVGSGYGFFRKALADAGIAHDGLEVSTHAADAARREFGFDTKNVMLGAVEDRFDVVTLWDVLEHVESPADLLRDAARVLRPGGAVLLRTPNLRALELRVFGAHYHSLKREHLHVFSPRSLLRTARDAGFLPLHLDSESHLLRGFLGDDLASYARLLEGSDLFFLAVVHARVD